MRNSTLKKTIKMMRVIVQKKEMGVKERVTKIQEARVKVEVAIKEWGEEEVGRLAFLQNFKDEEEETMGQDESQSGQPAEEMESL